MWEIVDKVSYICAHRENTSSFVCAPTSGLINFYFTMRSEKEGGHYFNLECQGWSFTQTAFVFSCLPYLISQGWFLLVPCEEKDTERLIKCLTGLLSVLPSLCAPLPSLNMANALLDLMSSTACYDPASELKDQRCSSERRIGLFFLRPVSSITKRAKVGFRR